MLSVRIGMKHIERCEPQRTQRNNWVEKENNTENTEKKGNKSFVLSVLKKSGVERGGLCVFYSFCFLIFDI